ncbi:uncharacterized protein LOC144422937 [Styela clava]
MKIPLRVLLIRFLLIIEAFSLIKGEKCWAPMLCNNIPVWRVFKECEMNEELRNRKKTLEEQINQLTSMLTLLEGKLETTTAMTTKNNIIHTSTTDVEETTKPQEFNGVNTSSVTATIGPTNYPWTSPELAVIPENTSETSVQTTPEPSVRITSEPSVQTIPPGFTEQDIVRYDGRIFIPLASERVNKASAIVKCQQINGDLANIYNQDHMNKIMTFIRDNKMDWASLKEFHLGMTYDPINQILRFRNGTMISQSGFEWHIGTPYKGQSYSDRTNMFIGIRKDSTSIYQYIFNFTDQRNNILCEI